MVILPVTTNNLEYCTPIFLKSYNAAPWNYNWSHEKATRYLLEYMDSKQFIGFVLYDNNEPVGAILCHTKTWWTNEQLMIDELFVSSEKQNMGYGKMLLERCEQFAQKEKIQLITLMTNKYFPSYQFYKNRNYIAAEQYVFMFKQI